MLCSKCREVVKPVVAVDIDGTIGEYHGHFLEFAEGWLGRERNPTIPLFDGRTHFNSWFCTVFDVSVEVFRECKLAYRQGGAKRTMPIYPDAKLMIDSFREAGAEVWITTTRPYLRMDNIDPDTREWLDRHGIQYDGLIYDKEKYAMLADRVGADRVVAVVEDLPYKIEEAQNVFHWRKVIWRRTKWNDCGGISGGKKSLRAVKREVLKMITDWKEQNQ